MPHIIVKLAVGRGDQQTATLTEALAQTAIDTLALDPATISVAVEDVRPEDWVKDIDKPQVLGKWDKVYRKPVYDPF
jgi:4-oxalocrotonate tautomerase